MRRMGAGMTAAVLLAGLAATAAMAQDDDGDLHSATPQPKMWWDGWFTTTAKKPDKPEAKKPDPAVPPTPVGPTPVQRAAASREQERADLYRRWEVCERLMKIAVDNNDTAMQTQIDQLHERAWELYQKRSASLPAVGSAAPDELDLDRGRAAKPFSSGHLLSKTDGDDGSVVREVKP